MLAPTIEPAALATNVLLYETGMFENTVAVIPPEPRACPNGKIVVNVGQPRSSAGLVHRALIGRDGKSLAHSAQTAIVSYPLLTTTQTNATDNQIIRLQDQSLLAIKNGYIWSEIENPPEWFGNVSIDLDDEPNHQNLDKVRNAVFVFRSVDCGQSWTLWSLLDSAVMENGDFGWPQPVSTQPFWVGGFDRTELFQDPWTQTIYISGRGSGGPYMKNDGTVVQNQAGIIFMSRDNGKSWNTLYKQFGGPAPYVMTSTPAFPLVVFRLTGKGPWLHVLKPGDDTLSAGASVIGVNQGVPIPAATDPGGLTNDVGESPPCIARLGLEANHVLIAYPTLGASGRQTYQICLVALNGDALVSTPIDQINAADPAAASCILGAFIDDDFVDAAPGKKHNFSLFYWIEAPPSDSPQKDRLVARFKVFSGLGHSEAGYLSVRNGKRRFFGRTAIGHYTKGAFYRWQGDIHFLAHWREPGGIMGNIVSLTPPLPQPSVSTLAIDPLSILLPGEVYVKLTLPDPPPFELVQTQVAHQLAAMPPGERAQLLARVRTLRTYLGALEQELAGPA